jgi:hypothetical protein
MGRLENAMRRAVEERAAVSALEVPNDPADTPDELPSEAAPMADVGLASEASLTRAAVAALRGGRPSEVSNGAAARQGAAAELASRLPEALATEGDAPEDDAARTALLQSSAASVVGAATCFSR